MIQIILYGQIYIKILFICYCYTIGKVKYKTLFANKSIIYYNFNDLPFQFIIICLRVWGHEGLRIEMGVSQQFLLQIYISVVQ